MLKGVKGLGKYVWSPDGQYIYYAVQGEEKKEGSDYVRLGGLHSRLTDYRETKTLYVATVHGGARHALTETGSFAIEDFALSPDGTSVEKKWSEKSLDVHHGGVVLVDGNIHGASSRGEWVCLDLQTGKVRFTDRVKSSDRLVGKGSVIYVDGMLYGYGEKGDIGLIRIKPDGYELVSSFPVKKGSKQHWAHPAISDGRLYVRHGEALMCYDIKAQ